MSGTPVVEASNISVEVDRAGSSFRALDGVSISVARGEHVALIGHNGAGKSTFCRAVVGIGAKYSGDLTINGADARTMTKRDRARAVAHVPQNAAADSPYTVRELLMMSRYPWRGSSDRVRDEAAAEGALALIGIGSLADRPLNALSGGERQRALIAAAAAQETDCVVLDEPTSFLDFSAREDACRAIAQLKRTRGVAIITVTHDINLALAISDKIVAISRGRVLWQKTPADLASGSLDELERVYGIAFERFVSGGRSVIEPIGSGISL